jgi:hypothetical protein
METQINIQDKVESKIDDKNNQEYINKIIASHEKQLLRVRLYNKTNAKEMNERARNYFQNVIKPNPEKYEKYKEKKKQHYRKNNPPQEVLPIKEFE